jgi:deazaflavin-dependent oxidoreductase (nitroreductase family)
MFARRPCLVLTTTGRRSGRPRTVVLVYVADGDRWIVVASNMGSHHAPAWLENLRADPAATVTIGGRTSPVIAREATADEHDALWPRVDRANYGQYGRYQAIAARRIPLVILEPAGEGRPAAGTGRGEASSAGTGRGEASSAGTGRGEASSAGLA